MMSPAANHPDDSRRVDQMPDEDRLDRNNRNISAGNADLSEKLYDVREAVAIIATKVEALTITVDKRLDTVDASIKEAVTRYATKEELKDVENDVDKVKTWLSWAGKIVIGAFILALVAIVFKNGVPGK